VRQPGTPIENTVISLAGPAINLVLFMPSHHVAATFAGVNGFLSLFNLLPFIPASDGQRVYRLWCHKSAAPL
jgi:Zn-dependent protease